ncbi:MAG: NAD(P)H-dependent oxidoreductase [Clostridia bacterium]|nr:NAD(P)H-dependent oxidoreductase [Clostridia bacterium]
MKTVIIHGQDHKGSTYNIAHTLAEKIGGETKEFFLPRDFGEFCLGCTACFVKGEERCPHYEKLLPITEAIDAADVIILASPVYVYHATGAMKVLLDHYGYRWMAHRPDERMYKKQGVCVCTAAGAGIGSTLKDMADSLFFWGTARTYKLGLAVAAVDWNGVSEKKKRAIDRSASRIAEKIIKRQPRIRPGVKTKVMFGIMRLVQKNGWNKADVDYWKEKGWLGRKRPWKD